MREEKSKGNFINFLITPISQKSSLSPFSVEKLLRFPLLFRKSWFSFLNAALSQSEWVWKNRCSRSSHFEKRGVSLLLQLVQLLLLAFLSLSVAAAAALSRRRHYSHCWLARKGWSWSWRRGLPLLSLEKAPLSPLQSSAPFIEEEGKTVGYTGWLNLKSPFIVQTLKM